MSVDFVKTSLLYPMEWNGNMEEIDSTVQWLDLDACVVMNV